MPRLAASVPPASRIPGAHGFPVRPRAALTVAELRAAVARGQPGHLPAQVTLAAPAATSYAALVGTLAAAHALGVRRARVVVERAGGA